MLSTAKILKASDQLFAQQGFENVSMQDISKASKVSIGSIYHAFKGKDDIAVTLLENYILDLQTKFGEIFNQTILDEKLENIIQKIISILLELGQKYPSTFGLSKIVQNPELERLDQKMELETCSKIVFLLRLKLPELSLTHVNIKAKMCYWICSCILEKWEFQKDDLDKNNLIKELETLLLGYLEII